MEFKYRAPKLSQITPAMEDLILNKWHHGVGVHRILLHLRAVYKKGDGDRITSNMVYNLINKARRRGDYRAVRRHTSAVVNASAGSN